MKPIVEKEPPFGAPYPSIGTYVPTNLPIATPPSATTTTTTTTATVPPASAAVSTTSQDQDYYDFLNAIGGQPSAGALPRTFTPTTPILPPDEAEFVTNPSTLTMVSSAMITHQFFLCLSSTDM